MIEFVRIGFAAHRVTRLYQRDLLTLDLRKMIERKLLGIDEDGIPIGMGNRDALSWRLRYKLDELLGCPYCLQVWAAMFFALIGKRRSAVWLLNAMAAAGVAATVEDWRASRSGGY